MFKNILLFIFLSLICFIFYIFNLKIKRKNYKKIEQFETETDTKYIHLELIDGGEKYFDQTSEFYVKPKLVKIVREGDSDIKKELNTKILNFEVENGIITKINFSDYDTDLENEDIIEIHQGVKSDRAEDSEKINNTAKLQVIKYELQEQAKTNLTIKLDPPKENDHSLID